jgi:hypothetical protein
MAVGGEFRQQDGQIVVAPQHGDTAHVEAQWRQRRPAGFEAVTAREAWREGVPVDIRTGEGGAARLHPPTQMVLVSQFGFLQTAAPASWFAEVAVDG